MNTPFVAEVIETGKLTYGENPTSDTGKVLPVGSIKVRPIVVNRKTNLSFIYAKPLTLSIGAPPLNGEHVLIFQGPSIGDSSGDNVHGGYYYFPFAINVTDDAVINQAPDHDFRIPPRAQKGSSKPNLPVFPGKTFPFPARPIRALQWYEGDMVLQNRGGASMRLGIGTRQNAQYAAQPEHHATPNLGSPLFSIVCDEPNSPKLRPLVEIASAVANVVQFPAKKLLSQKFRTESLKRVKTGIYGGISLQLPNIILARRCLADTLSVPVYRAPQIALDSDRIVLNAKRDKIFILGRQKAIIEAKQIILATDKHRVNLDEFVDAVQDLAQQLFNLTAGIAVFATPVGPTSFATNVAKVLQILLRLMRLNSACISPPIPPDIPSPSADFGVNIVKPPYGQKRVPKPSGQEKPAGTGAASPSSATNIDIESSESTGVEGQGGSGTGAGTGGQTGSGGGSGSGSSTGETIVDKVPPVEQCNYILHMFDSSGNSWAGSSVTILLNGQNIGTYSALTASTLVKFNTKKSDSIEVIYTRGINETENSYLLALDGVILYSDGPEPKPGNVYKHTCKDTLNRPLTSTAPTEYITFATKKISPGDEDVPVILYELESSTVSTLNAVEGIVKFNVGLITANTSDQGWYVVPSDTLSFKPAPELLLTKDILADSRCLADNLQRTRCESSILLVAPKLKKIPYTITLKK